LARGRSRSATIEQTVDAIKSIAHNNIKEIILTGVNIGDFGTKNGETFFDLIRELDKIEGIERFRISSIEPNLLTPEIIAFVAGSKKFVPHFHIPLQSGSDKILKAMRRKYLRNLYAERIQLIKSSMPDCCIGVDVIVGFPGETEEDFLDTYNFINDLDVSYLHVFTYSERENTTAIKIKEVVPMAERNKRSKMLHILSEKKKRFFYEQQQGKIKTVLFEAENNGQFMYGFTENYVKVRMAYDPMLVNETRKVRLLDINEEGDMNCREYHENLVLVHS
jgi:threonylcarbamoyladenosine tRNA methylthiotransferase MtaB